MLTKIEVQQEQAWTVSGKRDSSDGAKNGAAEEGEWDLRGADRSSEMSEAGRAGIAHPRVGYGETGAEWQRALGCPTPWRGGYPAALSFLRCLGTPDALWITGDQWDQYQTESRWQWTGAGWQVGAQRLACAGRGCIHAQCLLSCGVMLTSNCGVVYMVPEGCKVWQT